MKNKLLKIMNIIVISIGVMGLTLTCSGCSQKASSDTAVTAGTEQSSEEGETVAEKSAKLIDATKYTLDAPFTEATWASSADDVIAKEGKASGTYDSIYGGTTYVFDTSYENKDGSIKYMFDDKGALMCVAFTYLSSTPEEVTDLYNTVNDKLTSSLGESGYKTNQSTNYGNVWYREEGDVVVSCMVTSEQNSLQYSYLNPIVSKYQMEEAASK